MDRETAVKLFAELNRGAPDGVVSGRVLEAFATAVERMTLVAQVGNMERGIAAADARVVGAVAAGRERWLKAATAALELLDDLPAWSNAGHACQLLREALRPNVRVKPDTTA